MIHILMEDRLIDSILYFKLTFLHFCYMLHPACVGFLQIEWVPCTEKISNVICLERTFPFDFSRYVCCVFTLLFTCLSNHLLDSNIMVMGITTLMNGSLYYQDDIVSQFQER